MNQSAISAACELLDKIEGNYVTLIDQLAADIEGPVANDVAANDVPGDIEYEPYGDHGAIDGEISAAEMLEFSAAASKLSNATSGVAGIAGKSEEGTKIVDRKAGG